MKTSFKWPDWPYDTEGQPEEFWYGSFMNSAMKADLVYSAPPNEPSRVICVRNRWGKIGPIVDSRLRLEVLQRGIACGTPPVKCVFLRRATNPESR